MGVTLDTVARALGVSPSTVSRAFTRPELISDETRYKILAVAEELGYRPNHAARGLATGKTMTLALLVPDIANPFFPPLVRAAEDRAQEAGYSMLLADTDEHADREGRLLRQLAGQADGVVLCSPRSPAAGIRRLAEETPLVLINRAIEGIASVSCVTSDGMRQIVDHLHTLGHREIVYVGGPKSSWSNQERSSTVRRQARKHAMTAHVVGPCPATFEGGFAATEEVLKTTATAVVAFDDMVAMGVVEGLRVAGRQVPDDISVSGCDDGFFASISSPALTTVRSSSAAAARTAVQILLTHISSGEHQHDSVVLEGHLVVRQSTGPAPRKSRQRQ